MVNCDIHLYSYTTNHETIMNCQEDILWSFSFHCNCCCCCCWSKLKIDFDKYSKQNPRKFIMAQLLCFLIFIIYFFSFSWIECWFDECYFYFWNELFYLNWPFCLIDLWLVKTEPGWFLLDSEWFWCDMFLALLRVSAWWKSIIFYWI